MAFQIYKPGQGFWVRVITAIAVGVLVLFGTGWIWSKLEVLATANKIYIQAAVAVLLILGFGVLTFWILNKSRTVDFMIATEAEMKKVNWPSRREVTGATWIVICGMFMMGVALYVVDVAFAALFRFIGVLPSTGN